MDKGIKKVLVVLLVAILAWMNCGVMTVAAQALEPVLEEAAEKVKQDELPEIVRVLEEECDEYTTVFLCEDGTYSARLYSGPVRFRDDDGNLVDIDTSFVQLEGEEKKAVRDNSVYNYRSKATEVETYLPDQVTEENPVLVTYDKYAITMAPIEIQERMPFSKTTEDLSEDTEEMQVSDEMLMVAESVSAGNDEENNEALVTEDALVYEDALPVADKKYLEVKAEDGEAQRVAYKDIAVKDAVTVKEDVYGLYDDVPEKKLTKIRYEEETLKTNEKSMVSMVSYEYSVLNDGIKEDIILHQYMGINRFSFKVTMENSYAKLREDGTVMMFDDETDEEIGAILRPNMRDSSEDGGGYNIEDVHYELEETVEGYILTVVVDESYLTAKERVYPVIIDPNTAYEGNSQITDVYVKSGYPNTNFYSSDTRVMPVGYGTEGYSRTFIKFPTANTLLHKKVIRVATFRMWEDGSNTAPFATLQTYRVTADWNPSTLTWNNKPAAVALSGTTTFTGPLERQHTHDFTRILGMWAGYTSGALHENGYPNYGIMLRATVESTSVRNYCHLYGSRSGGRKPYLTVYYSDPAVPLAPTIQMTNPTANQHHLEVKFLPADAVPHYTVRVRAQNLNSKNAKTVRYTIPDKELTTSGGYLVWSSRNSTGFWNEVKAKTGWSNQYFPLSANDIFGTGQRNYWVDLASDNSLLYGVYMPYAAPRVVTIPDQLAPNPVSTASITSITAAGTGKVNVSGTFTGVVDRPQKNSTSSVAGANGMSKYVVYLYRKGTGTNLTPTPYTVADGGPYTHNFSFSNVAVNATDQYFDIRIVAYDKGNYSVTNTIPSNSIIPPTHPPSAPTKVWVTPSGWTNQYGITINWEGITSPSTSIQGDYKIIARFKSGSRVLSGTHSGQTVSTIQLASNAAAGSFNVPAATLQSFTNGIEGPITVEVYAQNNASAGPATAATYYKDTIAPTASIISPTGGAVTGTVAFKFSVSDSNTASGNVLSWALYQKREGLFSSYGSPIQSGTSTGGTVTANVDTSNLQMGRSYSYKIRVTDAAGNYTEDEISVTIDSSGSNVSKEFEIVRALDGDHNWMIEQYDTAITLRGAGGSTVPGGQRALFIDGDHVKTFTGESVTFDLRDAEKYPEGSQHFAVVRIIENGVDKYSSNIVKHTPYQYNFNADSFSNAAFESELFPVRENVTAAAAGITLANLNDGANIGAFETQEQFIYGKIASVYLSAVVEQPAGTEIRFYVRVNGTDVAIENGVRIYAEELLEEGAEIYETDNIIQFVIELESSTGSLQKPILKTLGVEVKQFAQENDGKFIVHLIDEPKMLTATPQINYMTLLRWEESATEGVTYNVYRALKNDEMPNLTYDLSDMELIGQGIETAYWYDNNIQYGETFVYRITAQKQLDINMPSSVRQSLASNGAEAKIVDENEVDKRLGLQDYWDYSNVDTAFGTGYVEVSKGNFVYQAVDTMVSGPKLALVMRRTYNSQATNKSPLGYGWDFSFNTTLLKEYNHPTDKSIVTAMLLKDGDGTIHRFVCDGDGFITPNGIHMTLKKSADGYIVERHDGIHYVFSDQLNQVIRMYDTDPVLGDSIEFTYDERGNLERVTNKSGASIRFYYNEHAEDGTRDLLTHIQLADEPYIEYVYENGYLVQCTDVIGQFNPYAAIPEASVSELFLGVHHIYAYDEDTHMLHTIKETKPRATSAGTTNAYVEYGVEYQPYGKQVSRISLPDGSAVAYAYTENTNTVTTEISSYTNTNTLFSEATYETGAGGAVLHYEDNAGSAVTYTRDNNYNILTITAYNTVESLNDNLEIISSPNTQVRYTYIYDSHGNVATIAAPDGTLTQYTYDSNFPHKVTRERMSKGGEVRLKEYVYDAVTGNLTAEKDGTGKWMYYGYSAQHPFLRTSSTDRFGKVTNYVYDIIPTAANSYKPTYRLVRIEGPQATPGDASSASVVRYADYDVFGNPKTVIDANGNYTKYLYNQRGQLVMQRRSASAVQTTQNSNLQYYTYYQDGRLRMEVDANGNSTHYYYDVMGRVIRQVVGEDSIDEVTYETAYAYETKTIGGISTLCLVITKTQANLGRIVSKQYINGLGQVVYEKAQGKERFINYDAYGNIIEIKDGSGLTTRYLYDNMMRKTAIASGTENSRVFSRYEYNMTGDTIAETVGIASGNSGYRTEYEFDGLSRLTKVVEPGNIQTGYVYDIPVGSYIQNVTTNPRGLESRTIFDAAGRVIAQEEGGAGVDTIRTEYKYDKNGNVVETTRAAGTSEAVTNWFEYDYANNRIKAVYEKDGSTLKHYTTYAYDKIGNRTQMRDVRQQRQTTQVSQADYYYDGRGNLVQYFQDGEMIRYRYDELDNLTRITFYNTGILRDGEYGSNIGYTALSYDYNANNLLASIRYHELPRSFEHYEELSNTAGRLVRTYQYDSNGRLTGEKTYRNFENAQNLTAPGEHLQKHYTYNNLGLVSRLWYTDSKDNAITEDHQYMYDSRGYITTETDKDYYGDDEIISNKAYHYDAIGRLNNVSHTRDGETNTTSYTYDNAGNRLSMTTDGKTTNYTFNLLNQLTSSTTPITVNGQQNSFLSTYTYSKDGSLISEVVKTPLNDLREELYKAPEYYIEGRLEQTKTASYGYDKAGNLVSSDVEYVVEGMAERLVDKRGNVVETLNEALDPTTTKESVGLYMYNGDGQRVQKLVDLTALESDGNILAELDYDEITVTDKYYYAGSMVLFTASLDGCKKIENVLTPDGSIIASNRFTGDNNTNDNIGFYTYNSDIRGSVTNIIRPNGTRVTGYEYDEFGNQTRYDSDDGVEEEFLNDATFTGAIYDKDTDLYYMNARYYSPTTGQFTQRDTYLGNAYIPWTLNLYTYTGNNPINYVDPTGHNYIAIGPSFYASAGMGTGVDLQLAFDSDGNVGILKTYYYGGGSPSISASLGVTYSTAPDLKMADGLSFAGGGGGTGGIGLELGVAYVEDGANIKSFKGTIGFGSSIPELHAGISQTEVEIIAENHYSAIWFILAIIEGKNPADVMRNNAQKKQNGSDTYSNSTKQTSTCPPHDFKNAGLQIYCKKCRVSA